VFSFEPFSFLKSIRPLSYKLRVEVKIIRKFGWIGVLFSCVFGIPSIHGHSPETAPAFLAYRPSMDIKKPFGGEGLFVWLSAVLNDF